MSAMTIARKSGRLVQNLIWFVPTFLYELVMFIIGKRGYSKRRYERDFDYGYNPPFHDRKETDPEYPDVWAYALEKTYEEFANDLRLAALMGIVYRFREPKTTEEFDRILSDHILSLRREPDSPGNLTAVRLWNPANVIHFLNEYDKKHGFDGATHYYINEKGNTNEWRIMKLGIDEFKSSEHARSIPYYSEHIRVTPILFVDYSFSGDKTSIGKMRFLKTGDASFARNVVSTLCNFVISVVSAMFNERDAAVIISRLEISAPQPFECVVQSAKMKLDWEISRPYWSEPDQVSAYFTIEKV